MWHIIIWSEDDLTDVDGNMYIFIDLIGRDAMLCVSTWCNALRLYMVQCVLHCVFTRPVRDKRITFPEREKEEKQHTKKGCA